MRGGGRFLRRLGKVAVVLVAVAAIAVWGVSWWIERPRGPFDANAAKVGDLVVEPGVFENRRGDTLPAETGSLVVSENRRRADSNRIRIAFVRFPAASGPGGTPVLFLPGGPGTSGIDVARGDYFYLFRELSRDRDVIVLDPRGVGASIPDLRCRTPLKMSVKRGHDLEAYFAEQATAAARLCLDGFRARGVDVAAYNDRETAADIDELRQALGYERWSLFGYSHGTQVAMAVLRDHGAGVERAVLAGPVAPDLAVKLPSGFDGAIRRLQRLLDRDPVFRDAVPNLTRTMHAVNTVLDRGPLEVKIPTMDVVGGDDGVVIHTIFRAATALNPELEVQVGRFHLDLMNAQQMGREAWIQRLPAFYHALGEGDFYRPGRLVRNFRRYPMPSAVLLATGCATGFEPERMRRAHVEGRHSLIGTQALVFGRTSAFCDALGLSEPEPGQRWPAATDHPVLFVVGTLDAVTPLENLPELRRRFPHGRRILVDGAAHQGLVAYDTYRPIVAFLNGEPVADQRIARLFEPLYPDAHGAGLRRELAETFDRSGVPGLEAAAGAALAPDGRLIGIVPLLRAEAVNALGYALLAQDRTGDAVIVLEWATRLRPGLPNAWDSLGEALAAAGREGEAIEAYRKSVALDPLNGNGHAWLRRLEDRGR